VSLISKEQMRLSAFSLVDDMDYTRLANIGETSSKLVDKHTTRCHGNRSCEQLEEQS